jgi:hypothetical protein
MRAGGEQRYGWIGVVCALGLYVLVPLTAANAQDTPAAQDATPAAPSVQADAAAAPPGEPAQSAPPGGIAAKEAPPKDAAEELSEEERPEPVEPSLSLAAQIGAGFMRGGHGGLFSANRSPLALEVQVLTARAPRFLLGGALRMELEGGKAVAAILRFQVRHPFGPLELRPGLGLPFYIAPRTMLGPEAGLWARMTFSPDLALLAAFSAAAFVMGDDVPKGSTVIMLQVFVGAELFI